MAGFRKTEGRQRVNGRSAWHPKADLRPSLLVHARHRPWPQLVTPSSTTVIIVEVRRYLYKFRTVWRTTLEQAVQASDAHGHAPAGRVELRDDPLEPAVDRLGFNVERGADDLAAVASFFVPQQHDVCRGQP